MTNDQTNAVLQQLCTSVLRDAGGVSDRQLLELFIERRDEAAFEALVRRHGPMVMGVCRRILCNRHDAEDAFQAAFLVLVRKAAVLASRELLAGWLYGVAYNTALKAKAAAVRRRLKERQATAMLEAAAETSMLDNDWLPLLDRELNGLPDKYRLPIVLCELQGKPHKEAAHELGCPIGTLSGRLSRGRTLLAKRLGRYGLVLTAGALSAALAQQSASATLPPAVVSATVKAATAGAVSAEIAALTEGVVKAMFLAKLKMVTMILGTVVMLATAALTCTALAGGQAPDKGSGTEKPAVLADDKPDKKDATKEEKPVNKDLESLAGTWNIDTMGWGDDSLPKEQMKGYKLVFAGNKLTWEAAIGMVRGREGFRATYYIFQEPCDFKIDPSKTPKEIDITYHLKQGDKTVDKTWLGIYEIKGDSLKVCYRARQVGLGKRPTEFSSKDDTGICLITLTRAPGKADKPKEAVKGLTAKIVVRGKVPDQIEKLELDLVLTNEGDQPVRLCTLCVWGISVTNIVNSISLRPNGDDSSISPKELEKNTVTVKPGESVTLPLPKLTKGGRRGLDGKYRIDATYTVGKEFAETHKTWQGHVRATTIIELGGDAKAVEDKAKADKIKPGDRIYIYVSPSLPDNPIRAMYEVEASGKVALGPGYGRVLVADMTPEEAEVAIKKSLGALVKNPGVSVSRKPPTPVTEGANPELERRVQQLEKEVRTLRSALDELQKKPRDQ